MATPLLPMAAVVVEVVTELALLPSTKQPVKRVVLDTNAIAVANLAFL